MASNRPEAVPAPGAPMDDPEQSARFMEAARELGLDTPESGEAYERAMARILSPRRPGELAPPAPAADAPPPKGSRRGVKPPE